MFRTAWWLFLALLAPAGPIHAETTVDPAFPVSTAPSWQYAPAISGNIAVWQDSRNMATSGWDVYGYNLATGEEFPICTAPGNQEAPAIDGRIAVWQDERAVGATETDIYGCNLENGQEFVVCVAPGDQRRPAISGSIAVWEDWRNFDRSGPDIYGCDLVSGDVFPVAEAFGSQRSPDVSKAVAVWEDWRRASGGNANSDILRSRIWTQPPQPSVKTSGARPAPVVYDVGVSTKQDAATAVALGPEEAGGRKLIYDVIMGPSHGALLGTGPTKVYVPSQYYNGVDEFWFKASDGMRDSNVALASVTVMPVNHTPIAPGSRVLVLKDGACDITLTARDPDGDALSYTITRLPLHGKLYGAGQVLTYAPSSGFVGPDAIAYRVSDGSVESQAGTVSILVRERNAAPEAAPQEVLVAAGGRRRLVLTAADPDGDGLTYAIAALPAHGTLEGPAETGCVTYVPEPGFTGVDRFAFVASDGLSESSPAAISIRVAPGVG